MPCGILILSEIRKSCRTHRGAAAFARLGLGAGLLLALSGCQSDVLPAVFGYGQGGIAAYAPGTLPEVSVRPGDQVVGQAANETGRCIFVTPQGQRFRADCPAGFDL